jgi:predicted metalloendopeptidase
MVSHALTTLLTRVLLASSRLFAAEPNLATSDLTAGMDTSIPPGDDFFSYANGNWLKNASIPPDRSSFGVFHN